MMSNKFVCEHCGLESDLPDQVFKKFLEKGQKVIKILKCEACTEAPREKR